MPRREPVDRKPSGAVVNTFLDGEELGTLDDLAFFLEADRSDVMRLALAVLCGKVLICLAPSGSQRNIQQVPVSQVH